LRPFLLGKSISESWLGRRNRKVRAEAPGWKIPEYRDYAANSKNDLGP
jgi:hypothetical protein